MSKTFISSIILCLSLLSCNATGSEKISNNPGTAHDSVTGEWQELNMSIIPSPDYTNLFCAVSSELDAVDPFEGVGKYHPGNLFDNKPATAWVEGVKGYGKNECIYIANRKGLPEKLIIENGYQKSEGIYQANSRPKKIRISLLNAFTLPGEETEQFRLFRALPADLYIDKVLEDKTGSQSVELTFAREEIEKIKEIHTQRFLNDFKDKIAEIKNMCADCPEKPTYFPVLKIEILDVYPGTKWDDTCISGIHFNYAKGKNAKILSVYESDDYNDGVIYFDTENKKKNILVSKEKLKENKDLSEGESISLGLMDVSPDKNWALINLGFSQEGAGRVEEISMVYYVPLQKRLGSDLLDITYGIYGFTEKDGKLFLDTADGLIDLDHLKEKIYSEN